MSGSAFPAALRELPLFPLQAVLFPGGLLQLSVSALPYQRLIERCHRESSEFGVVALKPDTQADLASQGATEACGVTARVLGIDQGDGGRLQVRCLGGERFMVRRRQRVPDGWWLGEVAPRSDDAPIAPEIDRHGAVRALANAIAQLRQRGDLPFIEPFRFDDAGWVANRWCEILPIPLAAKQQLMALDDPQARLQLVDTFLRQRDLIPG